MPAKERLDKLVVDRGLCTTRSQAQALIMNGKVRVKGQPITKPGTLISTIEEDIEVRGIQKYVSRGGLKLEKALHVFNISAQDRICIDIGASTGGFTDCLLQNGASHVISVDVGYGQLDWKLRSDSRVTILEKTNVRDLQVHQLTLQPSLGVVDTSFISLKKVLPSLTDLLQSNNTYPTEIVALLKPQFEYLDYLNDSSFKGVVQGEENHQTILKGVLQDLFDLLPNWALLAMDFSPITGPKGNIEFILHFQQVPQTEAHPKCPQLDEQISHIIAKSYQFHRGNEDKVD